MSYARLLPRPLDLVGVVGWLALAWLLALVPVVKTTLLAGAVALGALLLLPGYALVAALFPDTDDGSPTGTERLLFGVAASVALAMGLGVALSISGAGFGRLPALAGVSLLTLGFAAIAVLRRRDQGAPAVDIDGLTTWDGWRTADRTLTVGLAVVAVLAVAWIGALGAGVGGETFTEAYLLTEEEGSYVAGDYPETIEAGTDAPVQVGLENHRGEATTYTVVVLEQRVAPNDPTTVRESVELDRFRMSVPAGAERVREHRVAPTLTGEVRLHYLVYVGEPPATVTADTAAQSLQLWVTVEADPTGEAG